MALREMQNLALNTAETKDKQWERRLLDLSMKNALLNFVPSRMGLRLLTVSADKIWDALSEQGELVFMPGTEEVRKIAAKKEPFGICPDVRRMKELIALENQSGLLRTYVDKPALNEMVTRLVKKNKESYEEIFIDNNNDGNWDGSIRFTRKWRSRHQV